MIGTAVTGKAEEGEVRAVVPLEEYERYHIKSYSFLSTR